MGTLTDVKLNTYEKETLADGINLGSEGAALVGPHRPAKIAGTDRLRSEFTLDLLDYCEFSCPGCFVKKRTKPHPQDLDDAIEIMHTLQTMNVDCEDLFIGPTDIFSARNFEDLMLDSRMYKLTETFALSCTSTLMTDPEEVMRRMGIIEDHLSRASARDFDILVVIDIEKYTNRDINYLSRFESNLRWLGKDTVYFMVNFTKDMFTHIKLEELAEKLWKEYNVPLRLNPSFLRVGATRIVEPKAHDMVELLYEQLPDGGLSDHTIINMFDKYFAGDGFINLSFRNHELFVTPFIYEGVPQTHDIFHIPRPYTPLTISTKLSHILSRQFSYASRTNDCSECENLGSCVSRNVLAYMESRGIKQCIVPRRFIREPEYV